MRGTYPARFAREPRDGPTLDDVSTPAPTARRAQIEASVVAATEELLREGVGYAELNIERIATRAGISRTAFYFYFRDKREVLMRVTEGAGAELWAEADRWWSGEGEPELLAALRSVVRLYREHDALLRAVVEAASVDPEIARFWRELTGRFVEATRRRIEDEQSAGRARADLPAEGVAFALCWMTERTVYQRSTEDRPVDEEALVAALCAVWVGTIYG
jgi:TetR/AcrR family transcriptional regulator, ethionamide resistance regulator